jgi:hypothetical protein
MKRVIVTILGDDHKPHIQLVRGGSLTAQLHVLQLYATRQVGKAYNGEAHRLQVPAPLTRVDLSWLRPAGHSVVGPLTPTPIRHRSCHHDHASVSFVNCT